MIDASETPDAPESPDRTTGRHFARPKRDPGGWAEWRRRLSRPWLAGGAAGALLAAVLGVVLVWVSGESAACAAALAPPPPAAALAAPPPVAGPALAAPSTDRVYRGKASHYDGGNSGGNCSFPGPPANRLYVALGPRQYAGSAACGSYLDVTGPKGTVRVMVLDRCAGCSGNKIDLSKQAFAKIADLSAGIVSVRYRFVVDPPVPGPLTFRLKGGTSRWWFAVQVGDHGNPLASVEARRPGGGWRNAKRQPDNYWTIDGGLGEGPYDIRVTDIHGNQAVATGIRLRPGKIQRSQVRLYGDRRTAVTPAPAAPAPAVPAPSIPALSTPALSTPAGSTSAGATARPGPADPAASPGGGVAGSPEPNASAVVPADTVEPRRATPTACG